MKQFLLLFASLILSHLGMSQTTYYSKAAATDFNSTSSWGTGTDGSGTAPGSISNADIFVVGNGSVMTLSAPAAVRALYIGNYSGFTPASPAGTLTVSAGNSLTVAKATGYNTTLGVGTSGTLTITGGTITLNGNFAMTAGNFNQSGGDINLDGNDGNTAASSVGSGVHLFYISGGTPNCTAGNITIVDPPCNTISVQTTRSINIALAQGYTYFTGTHTFILGDGVSTTPGNSDGFTVETYSNSYNTINNLTVNAGNGVGRYGSSSFNSSTFYGTFIAGTLTINSGSEFRINPNSTSINLLMIGSIVNNGTFTTSRSSSPPVLNIGGHASLAGYVPSSASTISGSGVFRNLSASPTAFFGSITINNALGVTFGSGVLTLGSYAGHISGTLTMTTGTVNTNGQSLILGISTATTGTLSYTAGGFTTGSIFGRWFSAAGAGTTITASTIPTMGTGSYPFLVGSNSRNFHLNRPTTTGATGGVISVQHTDGSGLNTVGAVNDGGYSIDRQSAATWTVSTSGGFAAGTGTFSYAVSGQGTYTTFNTNSRLMKVATVVGTNQAGTTLPHVQRTAIAATDFSGTFYLGISSSDLPVQTYQSGKWEDGSTWVGGSAPSSSSNVSINSGHTITVDGTTGTVGSGSMIINSGGALTIAGGTLTIGASNFNNYINNSGTLTTSGGALTVNGNIFNATGSTFSQSSGTITIDGNNAGSAAGSVASGTPLLGFGTSSASFATGTVSLTGGTLIIRDPHTATPNTSAYAVYAYLSSGVNFNASSAHTLQFGDGSSTDAGGNTSGFYFNAYASASARLNFGKIIVNNPGGTNRNVTQSGTNVFNSDMTITAGTYDQNSATTNIGGNISVATAGILQASGTFVFCSTTGITTAAQTLAQSVSVAGSGLIKNLASSWTAHFTSVTINNTSATGVTFNALNNITGCPTGISSVSGTLTFTAGYLSTSGSGLLLGTVAGGLGSLTVTSGGVLPGSTFGRYWLAATTGSTITAGSDPATTTSRFPFIDASGNNRSVWLYRATPTAAGVTAITYTDGSGTTAVSIADGGYTVNSQFNGYWSVSTLSTTPSATSFTASISAPGVFGATPPITGNTRITNAAAIIPSSAHQAGTVTPNGQRTGITLANLTANPLYIGINSGDFPLNTAQSGKWEDGNTWVGGSPPSGSSYPVILNGHTVTVDGTTGTGSCMAITINSGGALVASAGTLNVGTSNYDNFINNSGTLTASGANININGNLFIATGATFNQSSGTITIDGNNAGSATGSVVSGTPLFGIGTSSASFATGTVSLTGGTLIIRDPHTASTNTNGYAIYGYFTSGVNFNASTTHTLQFGDGSSTDAGGNTSGFYFNAYASASARLNFGKIIVNNPGGTNRNVTQSGTNVFNSDMTITAGTYDQNSATTNIGGNISVATAGILQASGTFVFCSTTGITTAAQTLAQSVSVAGSGLIKNLASSWTAHFTSVTINNTSATGVTFNALNNITGCPTGISSVSGTLTFTAGYLSTSGSGLLLGTVAGGLGSLTVTSGGVLPGSTFGRYWLAATTGSTITAGSDPATTTSRFPFIDASGNNRSVWLYRATPTAAGVTAITYTDGSGTTAVSITDVAYTVDTRFNGYWTVGTMSTTPSATSFTASISAPTAFGSAPSNGNTRIINSAAVIPSSTHQNGTVTPNGQRTGITLANLTANPLYIGIAATDIPFTSIKSGNWEDGTTWNKGTAPTSSDNVTIANGHTVTVTASAGSANNVTVNSGGVLTVAGSTLTIAGTLSNNGTFNSTGGTATVTGASTTGITNAVTTGTITINGGTLTVGSSGNCNRQITNSGTLTVSSGNINLFGNLNIASGSTFNQSGGTITVDGNGATSSVASGTVLVQITTNTGTVNGGTMIIVDPPSTGTARSFAYNVSTNNTSWIGHTLQFGDGSSAEASANTNGFEFDCYVGTGMLLLGNVIVNGGSGTNRWVSSSSSSANGSYVGGAFTVNSGSEFRNISAGAPLRVGGNITNNGTMTCITSLDLGSLSGSSLVASTNVQSISGSGTFRNLVSSPTASLTALTTDNSNASGVTQNVALTTSGAFTITSGKYTIAAGKSLTAGGTTTLSGGAGCLIIKNTGSFIDNGTISGVGTAAIEMVATNNLWHYVAIPISSATANAFLGDYLATFNTASNTWNTNILDPTTPLTVMQGYGLNVKDQSTLITLTGTPNTGTKLISCQADATNGYTLTGNPYPSAVDLNNVGVTWPNTGEKTAWFWSPAEGNYKPYTAGSGGLHTQYAPAMQGFFVRNTAATSNFQLTNATRVHNSEPFLKGSDALENNLLIKATSNINTYDDETIICFMPGTTTGYDPSYDATKLGGLTTAPQLYTVLPTEEKVTINAQPFLTKVTLVPMGFTCSQGGTFTFSASRLESFDQRISIILEDLKENKTQNLRDNPVYTFTHASSNDPNRFLLHFTNPNIGIGGPSAENTMQVYSFEKSVYIKNSDQSLLKGNVYIYSLMGQQVYNCSLNNDMTQKINLDLNAGYYIVKVITERDQVIRKIYIN